MRQFSFWFCLFLWTLPLQIAQAVPCPANCLNQLDQFEEFSRLSGKQKIGRRTLEVVKIIYRRKGEGAPEIYFFDTPRYQYHFNFAQAVLNYPFGLSQFNQNYSLPGQQREFNLASLVLWKRKSHSSPEFLLELFNGDHLEVHHLKELYKAVRKRLKIKNSTLHYHPLGHQQEIEILENPLIPFQTTTELYGEIDYLPLNEGVSYGTLKFFDPNECYDNTHIVVYPQIPNNMGLLGGVITEEIQTPFSHINVKSMNRGTINMSLKNARKVLSTYQNRPVKLEVKGDKYQITLLVKDEAQTQIGNFWKRKKPQTPFDPQSISLESYKNDFVRLEGVFKNTSFSLRQRHQELVRLVGAKATNLALLHHLRYRGQQADLNFRVPRAIAMPFQFFDEFMQLRQQGLDLTQPQRWSTPAIEIHHKLERAGILKSTNVSFCAVKPVLKEIRELIQRSQVPPKQMAILKRYLLDDSTSPIHQSRIARLRLRSSTNSEDLPGFSGAGLYNSVGQWLYKKDKKTGLRLKSKPHQWKKLVKSLQAKITEVYSGVWNDRAFEEREWYSINRNKHLQIKVGILLHRGFPSRELDGQTGEVANGVAITTNVHDQTSDLPSIHLNSQHYDLAVTNPPLKQDLEEHGEDSLLPYKTEEILVYTFPTDESQTGSWDEWKSWSYEVLSRSSVKEGAPVLQNGPIRDEVRSLAKILHDLNQQIARVYARPSFQFAIDVEWKLVGDQRTLWIKQARPFEKRAHQDLNSTSFAKRGSNIIPRGPRRQ